VVFHQQQFAASFTSTALFKTPPPLPEVKIFETLPSTNQTLWQLLDQGATTEIVIAEQQTAGRGQWGRQWQSSLGGLYLSAAFFPNIPAANSTPLTLCSAWGIATALRVYGIPAFLKWPNDLLLDGRKLGGILTETRIASGQITKAVIGIGINWDNPVPETGINLKSWLELNSLSGDRDEETKRKNSPSLHLPLSPSPPITSLETLAAITLQGLLFGYQRWSEAGIEALLPSYLELLSHQGCPVVVNGQSGVVVGVTSTGELQVRLNSATTPSEICLKPGTISLGYGR
jgi:BirA family biotin operon repressor/biotin-[acetyl-CoA-carboxylase] ligase